jgi:hypothetical protein
MFIHITNPIYTIGTHLCASINYIIIPNIGTLALVNIPFKMHLAHIVSIIFLVMINVPFGMYLAPHVPIETLAPIYISFKMYLALAMVYIVVKMCLAFMFLSEP